MIDESRRPGALLGITANGEQVFDLEPTHIHSPLLRPLLLRAIPRITSTRDDFHNHVVTFEEVIGSDALVLVEPGDYSYFAQRVGRNHLSRFVRKPAPPTKDLVVPLTREYGPLCAWSTYPGTPANKEPTDVAFQPPRDRMDEEKFRAALQEWSRFGLVEALSTIVPGTEVFEPSWEALLARLKVL